MPSHSNARLTTKVQDKLPCGTIFHNSDNIKERETRLRLHTKACKVCQSTSNNSPQQEEDVIVAMRRNHTTDNARQVERHLNSNTLQGPPLTAIQE